MFPEAASKVTDKREKEISTTQDKEYHKDSFKSLRKPLP